jgi:hypothetical protein
MKRCGLCHRELGLGTRFRNIWNGRWWVHVQFCSVRCEAIYKVKRNDTAKERQHTSSLAASPARSTSDRGRRLNRSGKPPALAPSAEEG